MKRYIQKWCLALCCIAAPLLSGCSDDDDFPNKPKMIDVNDIVVTPVNGGFDVAWTPDPADPNFVFLNVTLIDQDNKERSYNVSRYGSSLVVPEITNSEGEVVPNPNSEEVVAKIRGLVNREYTLNFSAYNEQNNSINLGSRKVTPEDYTQCLPDSIYGVSIVSRSGRLLKLEWQELPIKSGSTIDKVFFRFTNKDTQETYSLEYATGIRHADVFLEEADGGDYAVEYGTRSKIGKEWTTHYRDIEIIKYESVEYWTADQKKGWSVTGNSVQEDEGPYRYLVDGNKDTFWSSSWGLDWGGLPVKLYVKLDQVYDVVGVLMQQRQNCSKPSWHRCVKDFSIYFKEKESDEYPETPAYSSQFAENTDPNGEDHLEVQQFYFQGMYKAQYVCISLESPMFSDSAQMCLAEFGIMVNVGD